MKSPQKSNPLLLCNARLITEHKVINKSWVFLKNGKVKRFGTGKPDANGVRVINVNGCYVAPGFIDLHIHGRRDRISQEQARHGTTSFVQSLHAQSFAQLEKNISGLDLRPMGKAQCLGIHLEGPFISKEMAGAQPKKFIKGPDLNAIRFLIQKNKNKIKIVTIAPEGKNSTALVNLLRKNKVVVALGHTNASIEQAEKAIAAGANYSTHIFNRMSGISSRNPGVTAQILIDDRITAEVIADGHHVHPANLRLLIKNKPVGKIVLVTDSVAAMDDNSLKIIAGVYKKENFVIAGSKLTMLQAVRNMIYLCGVSLTHALQMATINPAKVIGVDKRKGKISRGYDADIVVFDNNFKCQITIVAGEIVYNRVG